MAQMDTSDFDDEEESFPLQEDLTCPICTGIFTDPVLLPCSHSFCRGCLLRCLAENKRCPVCRVECREEQQITNRALNYACESFVKEKEVLRPAKPVKPPPVDQCPQHHLELTLFCNNDENPICVECVPQHVSHDLLPITRAVSHCKEELGYNVQVSESKMDTFVKTRNNFCKTVECIKHQTMEAEKMIKAEFERLHKVLETAEAARLTVLADEERQKILAMDNMIAKISNDIQAMSDNIDTIKKEMEDKDVPFLMKFSDLTMRARLTWGNPQHPKDTLLDMAKHVGSLGFKIWKDMQADINYNPVVFDPNTTSAWLALDPTLTSLKGIQEKEMAVAPANPERFDPTVFVMGNEGFTVGSGRHKWDVIVGDIPKWILGVCNESVIRKKTFTVSTKRGVWAISHSEGVYTVMTPERKELKLEKPPERIRISLNMDKNELSFWDGEASKHLCTLTCQFKEKIFPLFGPGIHSTPMVLAPGKISIHTS